MEKVLEPDQPGFDSQFCPLRGPGNLDKLFNLLRKLRIMTFSLQDSQGTAGIMNTRQEACDGSGKLLMPQNFSSVLPPTSRTKS